jgi:hypothetical protein
MKRAVWFFLVTLVVGCAEGQKPNPLPRAKEDKQNIPAKPQDREILWDQGRDW